MSATIKVEVHQLPHGADLLLPIYQTADAAGLDLLAAVPRSAPLLLLPGRYEMVPTGLDRTCRRAMRRRCGRVPASPPNTASRC